MSKQSMPKDEELVQLRNKLKAILDKRINPVNIKICEQTLRYGRILTSISPDHRAKMYKKFLDYLDECLRQLRELSNRIKIFKHAASHPDETFKDREDELLLLRVMLKTYLKNPITRYNIEICEKMVKHGRIVTSIPLDLRDMMSKRARECLDECDRQLKDLADRVDMYDQANHHPNKPSSSRDRVPRTINKNDDKPSYTKRLKKLKDDLIASRTVSMDEVQNDTQLMTRGEELLGVHGIRPYWPDNLKNLYAEVESEMNRHKTRFIQSLDKHFAHHASANHPNVDNKLLDEHPTQERHHVKYTQSYAADQHLNKHPAQERHHVETPQPCAADQHLNKHPAQKLQPMETTQPYAADQHLTKHPAQEHQPVITTHPIVANQSRELHYDQDHQHVINTGLSIGYILQHLKPLNELLEKESQPVEPTHPKADEEIIVVHKSKKRRVGKVNFHVEKEDPDVIYID